MSHTRVKPDYTRKSRPILESLRHQLNNHVIGIRPNTSQRTNMKSAKLPSSRTFGKLSDYHVLLNGEPWNCLKWREIVRLRGGGWRRMNVNLIIPTQIVWPRQTNYSRVDLAETIWSLSLDCTYENIWTRIKMTDWSPLNLEIGFFNNRHFRLQNVPLKAIWSVCSRFAFGLSFILISPSTGSMRTH